MLIQLPTSEILKDILTGVAATISSGAALYYTKNLWTTLKKTRQIQTKLEGEAKKLSFDPETGELVVSNHKTEHETVIDQIYRDGFFAGDGTNEKENLSKIKTKIEPKEFHATNKEKAYDLRHFELIENYYSQALNQSKVSFWFSLTGASVGFCVIILSIILYQEDRNGVALFSLISGVVIEAVSTLFFTQTNRDQKRRSEFFENLRKDKQYKEALTLCESIQDPIAKDALKIQIALSFAGVSDATQLLMRT